MRDSIRFAPPRLSALFLIAVPVLFAVAGPGQVAFAQSTLNPELTLTTGEPSEVALRIFHPGLVYIAYREAGEIALQRGPYFEEAPITLATGLDQHWPAIAISLNGSLAVYFEQADPVGGGAGIHVRTSVSGNFAPAVEISPNPSPDVRPANAAATGFGAPDFVWTRVNGATPMVLYSTGAGESVIAEGEHPRISTQGGSQHELVYLRAGAVYHRSSTNPGWGPEVAVSGSLVATEPRVATDEFGAVHVTFLSGGQAWYVRRPNGGGFTAPIEVTPGVFDVDQAELVVGDLGEVRVFYTSAGDIWCRSGALGFFGPTENMTETPTDAEDRLAIGVDQSGYAHLAYRRGGQLRYRNEVTPPAASFTIDPITGEAPHAVTFTDTSTGVIERWLWDFGDGTTSDEENPVHVYESPGAYAVTLSLVGPGGADMANAMSSVLVVEPVNVMRVPDVTVIRSQTNVTIPVLATHPDPMQGYQIGLRWDPAVFLFNDANITGTWSDPLVPDFIVINPLPGPNGVEGLTMGVVFDTLPPADNRTIPPGVDQRLLHINFDISSNAPVNEVSTIEFDSAIGEPPILNIFTVSGVSELPFLLDGQILVVPFTFPPPLLFLRGDYDNDGSVAINDAVSLLGFLFSGGAPPFCTDSADVNDNGTVDLSDPINLLSFLFIGGSAPPYPWPTAGSDPTDDPLGDC